MADSQVPLMFSVKDFHVNLGSLTSLASEIGETGCKSRATDLRAR